jgi:hypothetical protein
MKGVKCTSLLGYILNKEQMMDSRPLVSKILGKYNIVVEKREETSTAKDVGDSLAPLSGVGKMFTPLMMGAFKLGQKAGVKSEGNLSMDYPLGYEVVVASLFMAIQRERLTLRQYVDTPYGCYLEIALPNDMWSLGGEVTFDVHDGEQTVRVDGHFLIPGQKQAWGKGSGTLKKVFESAGEYLTKLS